MSLDLLEMATTPEQRRRNFETFVKQRKLVVGTWARAAEVAPSTLYSFLAGKSDSIGPNVIAKLAKEAGVSTVELTAAIEDGKMPARSADAGAPTSGRDGDRSFDVVGAVQAGVWIESLQWDEDEIYQVSVPVPPAYARYQIFGLEVRGQSMNELYPNKSIVFCVRYVDLQSEPRSGERVVVYRRNGELMEATLKEFSVDERGVKWLRPRSTHPDFQKPWKVLEGAKDEHEFEVYALVIANYRLEV